MIAAISLMRRSDSIDIHRFRRHWLDIHGPLVQSFPGLRSYVQCHVLDCAGTNAAARALRIDGFPILFFDNDSDRRLAHESPPMAACNIDSRLFIGAVSRAMTVPTEVVPGPGGLVSAIVLTAQFPAVRVAGLTRYDVLEQGPAPASTIPHLPVVVPGIYHARFDSMVALEAALAGIADPVFVVEEHWLPPT